MTSVGSWLSQADPDLPAAIVTPDGQWHEQGDVCSWGIVMNRKPADEWFRQVRSILSASPTKRLRREIDNGVVDVSGGDAEFLEDRLDVEAEALVVSVEGWERCGLCLL